MARMPIFLLTQESTLSEHIAARLPRGWQGIPVSRPQTLPSGRPHLFLVEGGPALDTFQEWLQGCHHPKVPVVWVGLLPEGDPLHEARIILQGSFDCVHLQQDKARLLQVLEEAREHLQALSDPALARGESFLRQRLLTRNRTLREQFRILRRVAPSACSVLIEGESGTGKELVARAIHHLSPRWRGPFVPLDCGAIPATLLESELFGHTRGAFTGAVADREGKILAAHQGTLFLDEVANLSPDLQAKLLRALQGSTVSPLGSDRSRPVDVRFLAACNVNLLQSVEQGTFRRDLYHRLKVVSLYLPPLRERPEDLPLLSLYFLNRFAQIYQKPLSGISQTLLQRLQTHSWPGNIRELENLFHHMVLLADPRTTLDVVHLPSDFTVLRTPVPFSLPLSLLEGRGLEALCRDFERAVIFRALSLTRGNQSQAARLLRIHRNTLRKKILDLQIPSDLFHKTSQSSRPTG